MNRYTRPGHVGGASSSRASASTVCQKCLQRGHYSYECKAAAQERPYSARPSRSKQLLNPSLRPSLTNTAIEPTEQEKSAVRQQPSKYPSGPSRKRSLDDMDQAPSSRKRTRSVSTSSSVSVSTISTRSPTPERSRRTAAANGHPTSRHQTMADMKGQPVGEKRRRGETSPSIDGMTSSDNHQRNTRIRRNSRSPSQRGRRRSRSASSKTRMPSVSTVNTNRDPRPLTDKTRRTDPDDRPKTGLRVDRARPQYTSRDEDREMKDAGPGAESRPRSLSPFSKRLALTQAISTHR